MDDAMDLAAANPRRRSKRIALAAAKTAMDNPPTAPNRELSRSPPRPRSRQTQRRQNWEEWAATSREALSRSPASSRHDGNSSMSDADERSSLAAKRRRIREEWDSVSKGATFQESLAEMAAAISDLGQKLGQFTKDVASNFEAFENRHEVMRSQQDTLQATVDVFGEWTRRQLLP
ncbi:hypothetical protein XA68_15553 [Ophiocordyceps unilateralis]|uniref:Uncharacterized protein n=1 Tax=Ophiocordyceps unilateralis TaxID=268505 RepID=A0A2A9P6X7_OPHUN|nr:hypothetical protein XA68_15553 [Ophiocordyceps unilateralis]